MEKVPYFIKAKTPNQKNYIRSMIENDIVICSGPSGTGKSLVALGLALQYLHDSDKNINKIYVTRPMVATSEREFPHLKGTLIEKLEPYYAPILSNITELLNLHYKNKGKLKLEDYLKNETIVMQPIELMRGFTYKNCFVLITEAQNMTIPQSVMAITRIGNNCKMIFEGDTDQKDINGADGMSFLLSRLEKREDLCGCVKLDNTDIQRHPLIGKILTQLNYQGNR